MLLLLIDTITVRASYLVWYVLKLYSQNETIMFRCWKMYGTQTDIMTMPPSVPSIPLQVRGLLPDAIYFSLARVLTLPAPNITLPSLNLAPPQPPSSHWSSQPSSETSSARVGVSGSSVSLSSDAVKQGVSSSEEEVVARLPRQPLLAIVTAGTSDLAVAEVSWQQKQVNAMSRTGSLSLDCESECLNTLCQLIKTGWGFVGQMCDHSQ